MSGDAPLHILVIAWLYVTLMMALAMKSVAAGGAFFLFAGCGPVVLCGWLAVRRRRVMRSPDSALQSQMKPTDDGDA
jgi:hypothetical protein